MDFFTTIESRRSVREFTQTQVPPQVIEKALDAALLAPNSSNMQSWAFYWVQSHEKKTKLINYCLNQSAAKTAQELIVFVATTNEWKRNSKLMAEKLKSASSPQKVIDYYEKLIPIFYGYRFLAPVKWLIYTAIGIFKPMPRVPVSNRGIAEVATKSTALAAENFMLAIRAQGFDTCPMEGFDAPRVKRLLELSCRDKVVMVVSVGERDPKGIWGEQIRFNKDFFIKKV